MYCSLSSWKPLRQRPQRPPGFHHYVTFSTVHWVSDDGLESFWIVFLIDLLLFYRTCLEYSLSKVFLSYGNAYRRPLRFAGHDIILLGHIYWLFVSQVRENIQTVSETLNLIDFIEVL